MLALLAGAAGCSDHPDPASEPGPGVTGEPGAVSAPPGWGEVPPGFDESPDGTPPVADDALDDAALISLLRTRASARSSADHCGPEQVAVTLDGYDAAAGHRYSRIVVRNLGPADCVVEGVPGLGVRGRWGSAFVPEVSAAGDARTGAVRLAPGEVATSELEWTGDLAGAESEPASLIVVQLAAGQVPATTPARLASDPAPIDIGQFTTIRLSAFMPSP